MANKAIIAGASGLIGSKLLNILLEESFYDEVLAVVRKELPIHHKKLKQLVIDFDRLNAHSNSLAGHAVFCCLGSTAHKTPDLALYRKIDHDYPLQLAQLARQNNVKQYHLVSAISANASSSVFYSKTKGETENDIIKIGIPNLQIYRPSLITGNRNEFRLGGRIASVILKVINPLFFGSWKNYRSIPAKTVAMAMYKQSLKQEEGVFIHQSEEIKKLS